MIFFNIYFCSKICITQFLFYFFSIEFITYYCVIISSLVYMDNYKTIMYFFHNVYIIIIENLLFKCIFIFFIKTLLKCLNSWDFHTIKASKDLLNLKLSFICSKIVDMILKKFLSFIVTNSDINSKFSTDIHQILDIFNFNYIKLTSNCMTMIINNKIPILYITTRTN